MTPTNIQQNLESQIRGNGVPGANETARGRDLARRVHHPPDLICQHVTRMSLDCSTESSSSNGSLAKTMLGATVCQTGLWEVYDASAALWIRTTVRGHIGRNSEWGAHRAKEVSRSSACGALGQTEHNAPWAVARMPGRANVPGIFLGGSRCMCR